YDRNCDVIGCDEGGSCGSIVVESGQVESREYFNHSGRAFRTTDGTITFGYKYPDDKIIFDGGSEGTVKIEDGKQFHSYYDNNTKYSGTINLQGINSFYARPDKYTVTFDENGGSDVDNQTVAHGMKATEPATTREGCTFVRWNNGEDAYDFNTVVTSDLTLTAEWTKNVLELANAGDNGDAITTAAGSGKVYEVTLSDRTLYKDGKWNTICLPFDVKMEGSVLDGAVARKLTAATVTDNETIGQTLYLTFGDEVTDSLKAGVPYIIKWEEGDNITDPVFTGKAISNTEPTTVTSQDGMVSFIGTYGTVSLAANDKSNIYFGSANKLLWPDQNVTVGAFRAYFKINETAAVNAKGITNMVIDFGENDEEATGINEAAADSSLFTPHSSLSEWHTVDGIRLNGKPSKKGMYIHNGKKVVVE
ncbi:MAG: InlB B-repeat-containing protein, partial [Prevotella sp.]|nr:InlB B-repeat-containing protein [Prevotella sp.]